MSRFAKQCLITCFTDKIKIASIKTRVPARTTVLKEWMTPNILASIRVRDKLHKKHIENPNNTYNKVKYIKYRNKVSALIKKAKENYTYNQLHLASGNIRQQYQ